MKIACRPNSSSIAGVSLLERTRWQSEFFETRQVFDVVDDFHFVRYRDAVAGQPDAAVYHLRREDVVDGHR